MIETVLGDEDRRATDRFDPVRELVSLGRVPTDAGDPADFLKHQRMDLGAVWAWRMTLPPATLRRPLKLIKKPDPETYAVELLLSGGLRLVQGTEEAIYRPYDLHICDSSRPSELHADSTRGPISCMGIEIPKRLLPSRGPAERVIVRPMSGREGIGALFVQFLTRLAEDFGSYQPADGPRLALVATDLASALMAHHAEDDRGVHPETQRRTLILRIRAFIQHHLDDPQLTPSAVAAAHHISLSYLHRLFRDEKLTVAAWIRHQRLERARRDLADRTLRPTPIHAIAARWGFPRAADFTRAFRTAYGISPMDYRRQAVDALPRNGVLSANDNALPKPSR